MNKKILFITDSLGLPRLRPEAVLAEEAWPYLLSSKLPSLTRVNLLFYYHCLHGLTTDAIVDQLRDILGAYSPDMVIMQVGIVDCYPRALKKNESAILRRLPIINNLSHWIVDKYYKELISIRNISYVDIEKFESNNRIIANYYKNSKFIVIPIAPPNNAFIAKNPKVLKNVLRYNEVLQRVYAQGFLGDVFHDAIKDDLFLSDSYHLSTAGNQQIVKVLLEKYMWWFQSA